MLAFVAYAITFTQASTMIDQTDNKILRVLEQDGRISNAALAERVGLSQSACLRRVQALEDKGIIAGYRAVIDRARLDGGLKVYVAVGLARHLKADQEAFERAMKAAREVRECHNVSGTIEYLLLVEVRDLAAYKYFHTEVAGHRAASGFDHQLFRDGQPEERAGLNSLGGLRADIQNGCVGHPGQL